jgi:hypothetical protein
MTTNAIIETLISLNAELLKYEKIDNNLVFKFEVSKLSLYDLEAIAEIEANYSYETIDNIEYMSITIKETK